MMLQPAHGWPGACSPQRRLPQFAKLILSYLELEVRLATLRGLEQPLGGDASERLRARQETLREQFEGLKAQAAQADRQALLAEKQHWQARKATLSAEGSPPQSLGGLGLAAIEAQLFAINELLALQGVAGAPIEVYGTDPDRFQALLAEMGGR